MTNDQRQKVAIQPTCGIFDSKGGKRFLSAVSAAKEDTQFHGTICLEVTIRDGQQTFTRCTVSQTDK